MSGKNAGNKHKMPRNMMTLLRDESKFLENFNPETSKRERRKLIRKSAPPPQSRLATTLFDEKGCYRESGRDLCDCLEEDCVGCHYPCQNCQNSKCGPVCRVYRRFAYLSCAYDGKDTEIYNQEIKRLHST